MTANAREVVDKYFQLMHRWSDMEFLTLFAENAVFVEPFSGKVRKHTGREAIKQSFLEQWKNPPPNLKFQMGQVHVSGASVRAEWSCTWDGLNGTMRGYDDFEIRAGKIASLEIIVTEMPEMAPPK